MTNDKRYIARIDGGEVKIYTVGDAGQAVYGSPTPSEAVAVLDARHVDQEREDIRAWHAACVTRTRNSDAIRAWRDAQEMSND